MRRHAAERRRGQAGTGRGRRTKPPAHSTTHSTSAATVIAAWGDGSHPRSVKPNSPTVLDSTNATRDPPAVAAAAHSSHQGPPATISRANENATLAWIRKPVP